MGLFTTLALATAGIATSVTLGAMSAANQQKSAKKQMRALETRDKIRANERVKSIKRLAASQRSSFLSSGIALGEGTTQDVQGETYATGVEDVENIKQYGEAQGEAISAKLRSDMLSTYGKMATDVFGYATSASGAFSSLGSATGSTWGSMGTGVGDYGIKGMGDSFGATDQFSSLGGGIFSSGNLKDAGKNFLGGDLLESFGRI